MLYMTPESHQKVVMRAAEETLKDQKPVKMHQVIERAITAYLKTKV